jgi:hypothetical protein
LFAKQGHDVVVWCPVVNERKETENEVRSGVFLRGTLQMRLHGASTILLFLLMIAGSRRDGTDFFAPNERFPLQDAAETPAKTAF